MLMSSDDGGVEHLDVGIPCIRGRIEDVNSDARASPPEADAARRGLIVSKEPEAVIARYTQISNKQIGDLCYALKGALR